MGLLNAIQQACLLVLLLRACVPQPPVDLGSAASCAVLAGSTVTNTERVRDPRRPGPQPRHLSATGFPGQLVGTRRIADGVSAQAQADLAAAYDDATMRSPAATIATELGGAVLAPGVYNSASGTFDLNGTLVLDAQGDPDAVFIFQESTTALLAGSAGSVDLTGDAIACNIFWQVGSSATLGTDCRFKGNILALGQPITLTTGAWADGPDAGAPDGAVTLNLICWICPPVIEAVPHKPTGPDRFVDLARAYPTR